MNNLFYLKALLLTVLAATTAAAQSCRDSYCRALTKYPNFAGNLDYACWLSLPEMDDDVFEKSEEEKLKEMVEIIRDPSSGYCTNGYVGRFVPSIPPAIVEDEKKWYFTCCPPDSIYADFSQDPMPEPPRTCWPDDSVCSSTNWRGTSDCWADGFLEPMTCNDEKFRYPHYAGNKEIYYVKYLCCDSPQENEPFMEELKRAQRLWMVLSAMSFCVCTVFITAILSSRKVRSSGYNVYLVFLAAPDAMASLVLVLRNAFSLDAMPTGPLPYLFMSSFEYFYAASNMWLNAVIVLQIHAILRDARAGKTVTPVSVKRACVQAGSVYVFGGVVFGWASYLYLRGLVKFTWTRVLRVWTATRTTMVGVPMIILLWVSFDVWHRKLLPIRGKTRLMALYFLRIVIVFLMTWLPYFLMYEISFNITFHSPTVRAAHYFNSVQGTISVIVSLSKPDVRNAVLDLLSVIPFVKRCFGSNPKNPNIGSTSEITTPSVNHSRDKGWDEDDVWIETESDAHLKEVIAAWKNYRKNKAPGVLDQEIATIPKELCHNGGVYRVEAAPQEQHPEESSSEQIDPLYSIWASGDIEDVMSNQTKAVTHPTHGQNIEDWHQRYKMRLNARIPIDSQHDNEGKQI